MGRWPSPATSRKEDATQVARVKAAGAIVLAKSNMAEWAFSPIETVSSILPGYTKNPYALDRVTGGSSGGTAAAVAASFGLVGFGSDTGDSIRGPSSHQSLAEIRSTMGLTSRAGVFPLNLRADIAGPIARTMEDAVKVFQAIAGEDPRDAVTAASRAHPIPDYSKSLDRNGLKGATTGVLHEAVPRLIGDLNTPGGDNSQVYSPTSGFPAINVPMGYTRGGTLPIRDDVLWARVVGGGADQAGVRV